MSGLMCLFLSWPFLSCSQEDCPTWDITSVFKTEMAVWVGAVAGKQKHFQKPLKDFMLLPHHPEEPNDHPSSQGSWENSESAFPAATVERCERKRVGNRCWVIKKKKKLATLLDERRWGNLDRQKEEATALIARQRLARPQPFSSWRVH